MSYENYEKAIKIITKNKHKCYFVGKRSENLIQKAEEILKIKFPNTYKKFLLTYGAGSYGSQEILGVIDDDFQNSSVPDGVWYTLTDRKQVNLPLNLIVIYETGNGEMLCLDVNKLNKENEAPVVAYFPGIDNEYQTYEKIADDFGNFLLDIVLLEEEYDD